jgi:hypothetical protein
MKFYLHITSLASTTTSNSEWQRSILLPLSLLLRHSHLLNDYPIVFSLFTSCSISKVKEIFEDVGDVVEG